MATQNKFVREMQEAQAADLRLLAQLSDDLESALRGPQKIKVKDHPKYVEGVTTRQGDDAYASDLRRFGPMQLNRAFGMNKGMTGVESDVRGELQSTLGKSKELAEYISISTQAICQVLMSIAENMESNSVSANKALLKASYAELVNIAKATNTNGIVDALESLNTEGNIPSAAPSSKQVSNASQGEVYGYLYPLNMAHIQAVSARVRPKIQNRSVETAYIANSQAQNAVLRYLPKHAPGSDVLLPAAIGGGKSPVDVTEAFQKYPSKSLDATFAYYKKAVDSEVDLAQGIRVGDVDASLKAAEHALGSAARAVVEDTGIARSVTSKFKSELMRIKSDVSRIKPTKATAQEDIAFAVVDILDLLGGISGMGTNTARASRPSGYASSSPFKDAVESIARVKKSRYDASSTLSEVDIEFYEAQQTLIPSSVLAVVRTKPKLAAFQNSISLALISLRDAFNEVAVVSPMTRIAGPTPKKVEITSDFKDILFDTLKSVQSSIVTEKNALGSRIDGTAFDEGILEAYAQILGVTTYKDSSSGLMERLNSLTVNPDEWDLATNDRMLNRIADGSIQTLGSPTPSGITVERILTDTVDSSMSRRRAVNASARRATRDAVLRNAQLLVDSLEGIRIQAENMGMQIRQNPASSGILASDTWWKKGVVGTGTLVVDHAASSLINRFAKPEAGSVMSHVADYAPSLLTAVAGAVHVMGTDVPVLNSEGRKNEALGYSLIGGAVGHAALRFIFKNNIGGARFSENPVLKALQYPTNGVAKALGDMSMGVSACCPANAKDHKKNIADYVVELARTNPESAICHISVQLAKSGLILEDSSDKSFFTASVAETPTADKSTLMHTANKVCMLNYIIRNGVKVTVKDSEISLDPEGLEKLGETKLEAAFTSMKTSTSKILGLEAPSAPTSAQKVKGFILEPGYNMNVYSGEDRVSYVQPAPHKTSQSGMTQLENAIARAARLGHGEKVAEGISDVDGDVIRATPSMCAHAEKKGLGMRLGRSRKNPHMELLAVEGDNGLMNVTPARQHSVPQGSLDYAKIGHAQNIDVTPNGLFNRGAFGPTFGK